MADEPLDLASDRGHRSCREAGRSGRRRMSEDVTDLQAEVDRLRAGEDQTPVPEGSWPTPGQWIARWNSMSAEQRLDCATAVVTLCQAQELQLMQPNTARQPDRPAHTDVFGTVKPHTPGYKRDW